jgi:hypothetical protein
MSKGAPALLLFVCLALGLGACGGGGGSSSSSTEASGATTAIRGPQPPQGSSPLVHQLYRSFQPPRADPEVSGSAKAIEAGEAACEGKTPLEVKRQFIAQSKLSAAQRQALSQIDRAEEHPSADFAAGQLAGLVYEGTLAGTEAEYGYRGCVYGLARGLEHRLAP